MSLKKSYSAQEKSLVIAKAALDKQADNVVIMKMSGVATICDYFVILSANTERNIKAIADNIRENLKKLSLRVWHTEGYNEASWVLIDCYDVVVHIFRKDTREFYDLEHLWADAPKRSITEKSVKAIRNKFDSTN
jgi:ribosome-associated protein